MSKIIAKYKKEAYDSYIGNYNKDVSMREAILESIFKPCGKWKVPGKEPMSHLHPNIDKLHLPHGVYIADWRKYKVEDHPALINFQKKCHSAGLHDPWLRNYAHQLYPNVRGPTRSAMALVTTGCLYGFCFAATIYAIENVYFHYYPLEVAHTPEWLAKYGKSHEHH